MKSLAPTSVCERCGFGVVRHLVAHAGLEREGAAVRELGVQFALEHKQDMALLAPVVGQVARLVLDHAHADVSELPGAPVGHAGLALVLRALDLRPVGRAEGNGEHIHARNQYKYMIYQ